MQMQHDRGFYDNVCRRIIEEQYEKVPAKCIFMWPDYEIHDIVCNIRSKSLPMIPHCVELYISYWRPFLKASHHCFQFHPPRMLNDMCILLIFVRRISFAAQFSDLQNIRSLQKYFVTYCLIFERGKTTYFVVDILYQWRHFSNDDCMCLSSDNSIVCFSHEFSFRDFSTIFHRQYTSQYFVDCFGNSTATIKFSENLEALETQNISWNA